MWVCGGLVVAALAASLAGCSADDDAASPATPDASSRATAPIVTIGAGQEVSPVPPWSAPEVEVDDENIAQLKEDASAALEAGELFGEDDDAIPLYLALRGHAPADADVATGFQQALGAVIERGDDALAAIDDDPAALRRAHQFAAVAREAAPDAQPVIEFLGRLDRADQAAQANLGGEQALNARRILGDDGNAAVDHFRKALQLRPGDARALQGLAAAESALIRQAELAADKDDYDAAAQWLDKAATVRPDMKTVPEARQRIARHRASRVGNLRDLGLAALTREGGLDEARRHLADLLRIAPEGDPAAVELREQIELASHYGLFRPGQAFTEALERGGRGPEMVVVPHGAFRMGAGPDEKGANDVERPARNIRFDRGLAVSRNEITVGEFRRFVTATGYEARATRRGYSTVYDERSGNLVRRSGIDWRSDYAGNPAGDSLPVVHVSAQDAKAYAEWLSVQTGHVYRLPSEAEFEHMLRAGSQSRFPWGDDAPPDGAGNFTGGEDESPGGRHWRNAFDGYGDGAWGPARVGSYAANAFGLHDLAGNVSEWVADCWHDGYRRAPADGQAWINPGCREQVVRGGSWASSPVQTRSAWRLGSDIGTTNARVGFRVVREI
ncbi:SUMF1/EgtB/PvdO family nonheme iron enzyme [Lysobacter sp. F60174L2]|uniref:SUMF1/EgtB/PvdO family nonheme iron enzyme n=1 Tax=Lysobacter sp. F60174L2 TaxID=3459295 RepID=UPI00403DE410